MSRGATLGWRRWFASTGTPPLWRPVVFAVAGGLVGGALGMLGSFGFVLAVVGTATVGLVPDVSLLSGALRVLLGAVGGLLVGVVGGRIRNPRAARGAGPDIPAPWGPMWAALRSFDEHARDGIRRAIPLGIGMFARSSKL